MQKIIFDCDVGVDDATALLMAHYDDEIKIELITTIFGNVGLAQATKNTCYIINKLFKENVPIYMGAEKAINSPELDAKGVHGKTGLGNKIVATEVDNFPLNRSDYGALEAMRDKILEFPNEVIIVSVGPTTNIANLFITYPEVVKLIKSVVLMVGSIDGKGSITPYSSFNAFCDPDAVDIIINNKNVPITISTKEMGITAYFDEKQRSKFAKCSKLGEFVYDLCDGYKDTLLKNGQYATHDTCAVFSILDTKIFKRKNVDMTINVTSSEKRGQTLFKPNKNSHITLLTKVNKKRLFKRMEHNLKNYR